MSIDPPIDLSDVQKLVFSGWKRMSHVAYHAVRLDPTRARAWLAWLEPQVTTWAGEVRDAAHGVQVGLTFAGVRALAGDRVTGLPQELEDGMAARARLLGDTTTSAPATWAFGGDRDAIHALVILHGKSEPAREALIAAHRAKLAELGGTEVVLERSAAWRLGEPFGFADGLSQPFVDGQPGGDGGGAPRPGQKRIPTGEILLGYQNAYAELPASPRLGDVDLGANGSYLVWRKLEQDVRGFWTYFADQGRALAGQPGMPADPGACREWLAARAMGRWIGGASTVRSPDSDDPSWGAQRKDRVNDFDYLALGDADGLRCPISSHVRRANPRDARGGTVAASELVVGRHRILRRGRAYGVDDARDRALRGEDPGSCGLQFVSLQSSIARGFEFIQQTWLANPGFHGLHDEVDPIVGGNEGDGDFTIPQDPVRLRLRGVPRFVTTRGGGYFFLPAKHALKALAALVVLALAGCPNPGPSAPVIASAEPGPEPTLVLQEYGDAAIPIACFTPGAGVYDDAEQCLGLLEPGAAAAGAAGEGVTLGAPMRWECAGGDGRAIAMTRARPTPTPSPLGSIVVWPSGRAADLVPWQAGGELPADVAAIWDALAQVWFAENPGEAAPRARLMGTLTVDVDGDHAPDTLYTVHPDGTHETYGTTFADAGPRAVIARLSSKPDLFTLLDTDFADITAFAALDLERDGTFEIFYDAPYYEGDALILARYANATFSRIGAWGCGA